MHTLTNGFLLLLRPVSTALHAENINAKRRGERRDCAIRARK